MRLARATVLAVVVAVATGGCGSIRGERSNTEVTVPELRYVGTATDLDAVGVEAGEVTAAPFRFRASELGTGRLVDGATLYDRAPLVMLFSVPSCPACRVEAPRLAAAAAAHPDVTFVVVHSQGEPAEVDAFNAEHGLRRGNVVHLDDRNMVLWSRFSVVAQPYYVLVDRDGGLSSSTGALGEDGLRRAVDLVVGRAV